MSALIRNNILLTYWIVGLVLWVVVSPFNIEYDDGGFKGALFYFVLIFQIPNWLVSEVILMANSGHSVAGQNVYSILGGLLLCSLVDLIVRKIRRHREKNR